MGLISGKLYYPLTSSSTSQRAGLRHGRTWDLARGQVAEGVDAETPTAGVSINARTGVIASALDCTDAEANTLTRSASEVSSDGSYAVTVSDDAHDTYTQEQDQTIAAHRVDNSPYGQTYTSDSTRINAFDTTGTDHSQGGSFGARPAILCSGIAECTFFSSSANKPAF